ncbi:hypothetical protein OAB01_00275 [Bacteroidia bacterium]|jgi:hypothetical protein|nr:hypothetical protein [Bacteroidia bacterium]
MKYTKNIPYFALLLIAVAFFSCNDCNHKAIEEVDAHSEIYRFDSSFYGLNNPKRLVEGLKKIEEVDSNFYRLYLDKIYSINRTHPDFDQNIFRHINSAQNQEIRKRIIQEMGDFSLIRKELNILSRYYKLRYPKRIFPKINTCYSGFAGFNAWIYNDSNILVDLDMYLGSDFEAYPQFYPQFKYAYYTKDYLVQNVGRELVRREFVLFEKDKPNNMLAMMLIEAAKIYELSRLMPCREEYKLFEYSKEQWEWALKEEKNIWQYLIKEELLFESEYKKYRPLIGEAPSSIRSGVADGAPPRIAIFAGYQILKKYMEETGEENSFNLLHKFSPEEILKKAKYKP